MYHELGTLIRRLRESKGCLIKTFAKQLKVSPSYITQIELHGEIPSAKLVKKIAKILKCHELSLMSVAKKEKIKRDQRKISQRYKIKGGSFKCLK